MGTIIKCPGCGRDVNVSAPDGTDYEIMREADRTGSPVVEIRIGKVEIHRCVLCQDGVWR